MTTVVEIPGTGEVEFPDSMSQAEIAAQVQRLNGANTPSPSPQTTPTEQSPSTVAGQPRITAEQALGQEATFRFLNNVIGVGDLAITSLANFESPFRGNPVGERPATLFEDITGQVPPEIGDSILPSAEDITAGLGATAEGIQNLLRGQPADVGRNFQLAQSEAVAQQRQRQQEQPVSTSVGQAGADVAALLTGRAPVSPKIARDSIANAIRAARRLAPRTSRQQFSTGVGKAAEQSILGKGVKGLKDITSRSAETGIEAGTLALINDGDPLETAGFAAGGQAAGSVALSLITTKPGFLSLAASAAGLAAFIETGGNLVGRDGSPVEALGSAFDKISVGIGLGLGAGLLGAGRIGRGSASGLTSEITRRIPRVMDAITAIPRGAVLSAITESRKDDRIQPVLDSLSVNPGIFSESERKTLERAMKSEKISMTETLDRLSKKESFARKLEEIRRPETAQPQITQPTPPTDRAR